MEISSLAGAVTAAQSALARQDLSIAMFKQKMDVEKAIVQMLDTALESAPPSGSTGRLVDLTV
jgi:hypothetical protein